MNGNQSSQLNRVNECNTENEFYSLYKIIGFGSKNNFSITKSELNGLIAWISGPYIIFYDIITDREVFFLKNINNKIVSCIQFSSNGNSLATGEGNCKNGEICLYDIFYDGKKNKHKLLMSYKAHTYGIDKLFFFKNDKYLLSIGNNDDKLINIMDITNKQIIYTSLFNKNVLCADICKDFVVICGNNFIQLYAFNSEQLLNNSNSNDLLIKRPVNLSKLKDKSFIYTSIYNNSKREQKIFFITEDCYLVEMKTDNLILTRWINLKANKGYNLAIWDNKIGCGCSDGIYRIFNIDNLKHIQTLHKPPPLGPENKNSQNLTYPDVMCNIYSKYHKKLILVYSNKYFLVWDINNMNQMNVIRYHVFQSGSIKNIDYTFDEKENIMKIATCSDDKTVIYWNLRLDESIHNYLYETKIKHITYSKYIRHIFYFSNNYEQFKLKNDIKNNSQINEEEDLINLTSVKFSVDQLYLYIGDSIGNLHIYSLLDNFDKIIEIPAHNDCLNTIDTITMNYDDNSPNENNKSYIATGSSDNYVNIFDISKGIKSNLTINDFNTIFEKMSSEVINLIFCIDKNRKLKLIVSESNSTISFFELINGALQIIQKNYEPSLKTYCLNYSPSIRKVITGHNGKIIIWKTSSNIIHKHFQVSKGDKILDNFRIAADSNGVMFATSNNDKNIRIRALHDGKLLCKIPVAESISDLLFILNDNYLLATSVEGYIYFYKINQNFINKLIRDKELINSMEEKTVINNKLMLLQKLLENDVSISKNEKVKNLIEKFQRSEDTSYEDLKRLDEFVIESKKRGYDEIIQLKEDKPNNSDDQDNQNNDNINENNEQNKIILSKSKLFEMKLKENSINNINHKNQSFKNITHNRVSLIDSYIKKENKKTDKNNVYKKLNIDLDSITPKRTNIPRDKKINNKNDNKMNVSPKNPFLKNISKTENNIIYNPINKERKNSNKNNKRKDSNNISCNIIDNNFKLSKNNKFHKNNENFIKSNINNNNNNLKINRINSESSKNDKKNYQKKIIETKADNNYNLYSLDNNDKLYISNDIKLSIMKQGRKKSDIKYIKKECNFKIVNYNYNNKKKLIKEIENIKLDDIHKKNDLLLLKDKLELLSDQIKMKLGITVEDIEKEKLLNKFGILLMDKINKSQNK